MTGAGSDDPEVIPIPLDGFVVTQIWFAGQLFLVASDPNERPVRPFDPRKARPEPKISLGGDFIYTTRGGDSRYLSGAASWTELAPILDLQKAVISTASADMGAHLQINFVGGAAISAEPDDEYENWEVSGPGALYLVAPPGGGDPRISV